MASANPSSVSATVGEPLSRALDRTNRDYSAYVAGMIARGGPRPEEYAALDTWVTDLYHALDRGELSEDAITEVRRTMAPVLTAPTMHGSAYCKPHGYAGDFEIIDRHYLTYITPDPHFANWDRYWHSRKAARAVRNRKDYFHDLLRRHVEAADGRRVDVLNLASGPGRDVFEFLSSAPGEVHFECIDQDIDAISHASSLCGAFTNQVTFHQANVLRFRPSATYNLVWAGGLFDYLSDRAFKHLLRRLLPVVAPGGELVIGNFDISRAHSDFHWLRFCEWILHHRNAEQLTSLAISAGASRPQVGIGQEMTGLTLFLHISSARDAVVPG